MLFQNKVASVLVRFTQVLFVCIELLHVLHVAAFNGCYANLAVLLPPGDCYGVL